MGLIFCRRMMSESRLSDTFPSCLWISQQLWRLSLCSQASIAHTAWCPKSLNATAIVVCHILPRLNLHVLNSDVILLFTAINFNDSSARFSDETRIREIVLEQFIAVCADLATLFPFLTVTVCVPFPCICFVFILNADYAVASSSDDQEHPQEMFRCSVASY